MMPQEIKDIMFGEDARKRRSLLAFDGSDSVERIRIKFNLWAKYYQARYFKSPDASFHKTIDAENIRAYLGIADSFTDIAFRGGAKTARSKLFMAYAIANDLSHFRKYIKVLSEDGTNSRQIVTDIYNIFVQPRIKADYPEIFQKTNTKREETMSSFTTSTGVKIIADTVGTNQRGAIQDDSRPDLIWYEDFENRKSLRSAVITQSIWDNMEEARTGLAKGGSCIYTCNYISESGNVHKLAQKESLRNVVLIVPIIDKQGVLAWPEQYTLADVDNMRATDEDFEGERLCEPSASADIVFDRAVLEAMTVLTPIDIDMGFQIFKKYDKDHCYGSGHDVSGGVGLDSSTSVFIDFSSVPAEVVATFKTNTVKPAQFGEEIHRESKMYGKNLIGVENNYGTSCIERLRQLGANLYGTKPKDSRINQFSITELGWNTNSLTKGKMLFALAYAIKKGLLVLNDKHLIQEIKSYTRNDLMDTDVDARLTTRHFDLLMACAIAWQMKDYAFSYFIPATDPKPLTRMQRVMQANSNYTSSQPTPEELALL